MNDEVFKNQLQMIMDNYGKEYSKDITNEIWSIVGRLYDEQWRELCRMVIRKHKFFPKVRDFLTIKKDMFGKIIDENEITDEMRADSRRVYRSDKLTKSEFMDGIWILEKERFAEFSNPELYDNMKGELSYLYNYASRFDETEWKKVCMNTPVWRIKEFPKFITGWKTFIEYGRRQQ